MGINLYHSINVSHLEEIFSDTHLADHPRTMLTILMLVRHSDHVVDHQAVVERLVHLKAPQAVVLLCVI